MLKEYKRNLDHCSWPFGMYGPLDSSCTCDTVAIIIFISRLGGRGSERLPKLPDATQPYKWQRQNLTSGCSVKSHNVAAY